MWLPFDLGLGCDLGADPDVGERGVDIIDPPLPESTPSISHNEYFHSYIFLLDFNHINMYIVVPPKSSSP